MAHIRKKAAFRFIGFPCLFRKSIGTHGLRFELGVRFLQLGGLRGQLPLVLLRFGDVAQERHATPFIIDSRRIEPYFDGERAAVFPARHALERPKRSGPSLKYGL